MAQQKWFILILQMLLEIFRPKTSTTFEVTDEMIKHYKTYVRGADSKTLFKQLNLYGFKKIRGKRRFYTHPHLSHLLTKSPQSELKKLFPRTVHDCRKNKKRSLREKDATPLARPQKRQSEADVPVLAPVSAMLDNIFGIHRLWDEDHDTFWWETHTPCNLTRGSHTPRTARVHTVPAASSSSYCHRYTFF